MEKNIVSVILMSMFLTGCVSPSERGDQMIASQSSPDPELKRGIAERLLAKRPELAGEGAEVSNILPLGPDYAVVCVQSPKARGEFPIVYINERGPSVVSQGSSACDSDRIRWNPFPELSE